MKNKNLMYLFGAAVLGFVAYQFILKPKFAKKAAQKAVEDYEQKTAQPETQEKEFTNFIEI